MSSETPRVESFIVRFVQDEPDDGGPATASGWHGVVVHVQSTQEKAFVKIADAFAFMARYVSLGDLPVQEEQEQ